MSLLARLGLALVRPRAALTLAGERLHAGRSGSDLILALIVVVLVSQARALVSAVWLAIAVEPGLGVRALVQSLTDAIAAPLGFLVIGALVIWAAAGPRRDLGRASDLSCVAVIPILVVKLAATIVVLAAGLEVSGGATMVLSLVAYTWAGAIIVFAALEARRAPGRPDTVSSPVARRAGWGLVALAGTGLVVQSVWLVRYLDRMRPVVAGDPAPEFALPRIGAGGAAGDRLALSSLRGKVVVLDFWATWCQPCLSAMPRLEAFQRRHPDDVVVVAINIDDPGEARALFDEKGYTLPLLAGDAEVSDRYDVAAIPHTVVIDRTGNVRRVVRGGKVDLEQELARLGAPAR